MVTTYGQRLRDTLCRPPSREERKSPVGVTEAVIVIGQGMGFHGGQAVENSWAVRL